MKIVTSWTVESSRPRRLRFLQLPEEVLLALDRTRASKVMPTVKVTETPAQMEDTRISMDIAMVGTMIGGRLGAESVIILLPIPDCRLAQIQDCLLGHRYRLADMTTSPTFVIEIERLDRAPDPRDPLQVEVILIPISLATTGLRQPIVGIDHLETTVYPEMIVAGVMIEMSGGTIERGPTVSGITTIEVEPAGRAVGVDRRCVIETVTPSADRTAVGERSLINIECMLIGKTTGSVSIHINYLLRTKSRNGALRTTPRQGFCTLLLGGVVRIIHLMPPLILDSASILGLREVETLDLPGSYTGHPCPGFRM